MNAEVASIVDEYRGYNTKKRLVDQSVTYPAPQPPSPAQPNTYEPPLSESFEQGSEELDTLSKNQSLPLASAEENDYSYAPNLDPLLA